MSEYSSSLMNLHVSFINTCVSKTTETTGLGSSFGVSIIITEKFHRCTAHHEPWEFILRK